MRVCTKVAYQFRLKAMRQAADELSAAGFDGQTMHRLTRGKLEAPIFSGIEGVLVELQRSMYEWIYVQQQEAQ